MRSNQFQTRGELRRLVIVVLLLATGRASADDFVPPNEPGPFHV
jgi:hypothetical protein